MNKIAPDHLTRSAFVYVRQSTPDQLTKRSIPKRGLSVRSMVT